MHIFYSKNLKRRAPGKHRHRWEDDIEMDLEKIEIGVVD